MTDLEKAELLSRKIPASDAPMIQCLICDKEKHDTERGFMGIPICEDCFQEQRATGTPIREIDFE